MTALSECIAETRQKAAAGVAAGGPGVEAAGVVAGGDGGDGEGRGKGGDGKSGKNGGDGELEISGKKKRFTGALERAGLCGPLGGPAIANLPGAVWETPAFIDLMADAMLTREAVERRRARSPPAARTARCGRSSARPPTWGARSGSSRCPRPWRRPRRWGTRGRRWWASGTSRWRAPRARGTTSGSCVWIEEVVDRVRNTPVGRSLLLPGGWCTRLGGHPLVYAVRRHHGHYALAVTNCGDGLEYHPIEADPLLDGFRYAHTVVLDDVDPGTLMDASTWALLYRPLIFPAPGKKQSEHIYAKVLPFLNKRPLMASAYHERGGVGGGGPGSAAARDPNDSGTPNEPFGGGDDRVAPLTAKARGGDASCARLALEAARALVASSPGVSPRRADALVEMGVRHVLLESALQDLSQVPGERLAAAPAAALECACRALASAAGKHADALADAPPGAVAGVAAAAAGAGVAGAPPRRARRWSRRPWRARFGAWRAFSSGSRRCVGRRCCRRPCCPRRRRTPGRRSLRRRAAVAASPGHAVPGGGVRVAAVRAPGSRRGRRRGAHRGARRRVAAAAHHPAGGAHLRARLRRDGGGGVGGDAQSRALLRAACEPGGRAAQHLRAARVAARAPVLLGVAGASAAEPPGARREVLLGLRRRAVRDAGGAAAVPAAAARALQQHHAEPLGDAVVRRGAAAVDGEPGVRGGRGAAPARE